MGWMSHSATSFYTEEAVIEFNVHFTFGFESCFVGKIALNACRNKKSEKAKRKDI